MKKLRCIDYAKRSREQKIIEDGFRESRTLPIARRADFA
jgi:hypothetical protein